jgi:S1-C subfamily serine protease
LQRGDIILTVAGQTIHNIAEFQDKMGGQANQPGESGQAVAMQIQRDGKAFGISFPLVLE